MATKSASRGLWSGLLVSNFVRVSFLLLVAPGIGGADSGEPSQSIVQLLERAEALIQVDKTSGIALLKQVISAQRDARGQSYGYARYAHYRIGRYLFARGQRRQARSHFAKALSITANQDAVHAAYRIDRYDPFLTKNFPALVGRMDVRLRPSHIVRDASMLLPAAKQKAFVVGDETIALLDRQRRVKTPLYQQQKAKPGKVALNNAHDQIAVFYPLTATLVIVSLEPYLVRKVSLTADALGLNETAVVAVKGLHFGHEEKDDGKHVSVYVQTTPSAVRIYHLSLNAGTAFSETDKITGKLLAANASAVVYASYGDLDPSRADDPSHLMFDRVVLRRPDQTNETILYQFPYRDIRSKVRLLLAPSGQRFALQIYDAPRVQSHLIVHDLDELAADKKNDDKGSKGIYHRQIDLPQLDPKTFTFSFNEDYLLFWQVDDSNWLTDAAAITLHRYDWPTGELSEPYRVTTTQADRATVYGFGVMADNRTWWLHWGDTIRLLAKGKQVRRRTKAEWRGSDYYFPDPPQFCFGVLQNDTPACLLRDVRQFIKLSPEQ